MATTLQFRRGTTAELSSETGAVGELFVDTTKDTVVVMDGSTAGGKPLATESSVTVVSSHAQAAFDAANTSGNGSFTFSANTITLPNYTDGELRVTGNVSALAGTFNTGDWKTAQVRSSLSSGKTVIDITADYDQSLQVFLSEHLSTTSGLIVEFRGTSNTSVLRTGTIESWNLLSTTNGISTSEMKFTSNVAATLSDYIYDMDIYLPATQTQSTYRFSKTGEFITPSATLGTISIEDNIITPLPNTSIQYGYYANTTVVTDQPLLINGDLGVVGSIKNIPSYAISSSETVLEVNKQYFISNSTTNDLVLPQSPKAGDVVVINRGLNSQTMTLQAASGDNILYWNGSGQTVTGDAITLGATYKFRTFTCIATSASTWYLFDNTSAANPTA